MLKRLIAIILCLIFTLSLVACAGDQTDSGGKNSAVEGKLTPDIDLPDYKPTSDKVYWLTEGDASIINDPTNWAYVRNQYLKEIYGCELEPIQTTSTNFSTKAAQLVLSGQPLDLIQYRAQDDPTFIKNGIVRAVDEYFDFNEEVYSVVKDVNENYRYKDGKLYSFMRLYRNEGYCYYWLEDLAELNLETPRDLYKKGEWTWSKFLEYSRLLTVKSTDGTVSRYGAAVQDTMHTITGETYVKYDNGSYTNNLRSSKLADFWNSYSKATFEEKIFEVTTDIITSFKSHNVSMALFNRKLYEFRGDELFGTNQVSMAPVPKWDGADKYYTPADVSCDWISANSKNPEGAAALIAIDMYLYYDHDKAWEKKQAEEKTRSEADSAMDKEMQDPSNFELVSILDRGLGTKWSTGQRTEMIRGIRQYNSSWATLVENNYPLLEAAIKEMK